MPAKVPTRGEESFGLDCWDGAPFEMRDMHWHPEVELNFIVAGDLTYLAGGRVARLQAGQLALFWGALPHRVVLADPATVMCWLTVPLPTVLGWALPETFTAPLLHGGFFVAEVTDAETTRQAFRQWSLDLATGRPAERQIMTLELEARVRRLERAVQPLSPSVHPPRGGRALRHVEALVALIAQRYAEPLSVTDLADSVGLHPHYAMAVFKQTLGLSLQRYLTQQRLAHAQRLLATTRAPILDVAFTCGFTSVSQFYEQFRRSCGLTPRRYRLRMQGGEVGG